MRDHSACSVKSASKVKWEASFKKRNNNIKDKNMDKIKKKYPVTVVGNESYEVKYRNVDSCSSPYLELFIGSLKVDAFVDTGASFSAISPSLLDLISRKSIHRKSYLGDKKFNVSSAVGKETCEVGEQVELKVRIRCNTLI